MVGIVVVAPFFYAQTLDRRHALSDAPNLDGIHLDGCDGPVTSCRDFGDGHSNVIAADDLAEDGVLRCARAEPVQVAVVRNIDEELRTTRVRPARVGHGQGARFIGIPGDVLILDVPTAEAPLRRASLHILEGPIWRAAGPRPGAVRVLGMGATELVHKTWNHAVEMNAVVVARFRQVDEVRGGARHAVQE